MNCVNVVLWQLSETVHVLMTVSCCRIWTVEESAYVMVKSPADKQLSFKLLGFPVVKVLVSTEPSR